MARTVTRLQIRDGARALSDQVNSTFVTDTQANFWINQALAALWDILVLADPDRYIKTTQITTTAGTKSYALPSDFFKIRGVDIISGSERSSVRPYQLAERNQYYGTQAWTNWPYDTNTRYRIMGGGRDGSAAKIYFEPDPGAYTFELWYVEQPQDMSLDADTVDGAAGWEDWIIYEVAAQMATKEENFQLVAILEGKKTAIERRIRSSARHRDAGAPARIQDVRTYDRRWR